MLKRSYCIYALLLCSHCLYAVVDVDHDLAGKRLQQVSIEILKKDQILRSESDHACSHAQELISKIQFLEAFTIVTAVLKESPRHSEALRMKRYVIALCGTEVPSEIYKVELESKRSHKERAEKEIQAPIIISKKVEIRLRKILAELDNNTRNVPAGKVRMWCELDAGGGLASCMHIDDAMTQSLLVGIDRDCKAQRYAEAYLAVLKIITAYPTTTIGKHILAYEDLILPNGKNILENGVE